VSGKIYSLNKIKYWICYDVDAICRLYGIHEKTVLAWLKKGLKPIDAKRPILVYGYHLKIFLGKLNESNRCHLNFEEMFCMKCKEAKTPFKKQIQLEQFEQKFLKAKAVCQSCKTKMNKSYQLENFQQLKRVFDVVQLLELYDFKTPPSNTPFHDQEKDDQKESEKEPTQGDFFL
jgi:hypothetical protein